MKYISTILLFGLVLITSCKTDAKKENSANTDSSEMGANEEPKKALTLTEKIAYANGYKDWKDVEELKFTFNVDREGNPHFERSWIWKPKTNEVTMMSAEDTLTYNRNEIESADSTAYKANGKFTNDKFWLLAPINIMWDEDNTTTERTEDAQAPISKKQMEKLTVTYGDEGGYTPGDAYDLYIDDNFMVREWVYRKGNQEEPSMTTTWEDYTDADGIKIAQMHQNQEGNFKLYFTDVEVTTE